MTQAQLAELTGMTEGNISRLESGKHLPSLGTLRRLLLHWA
jgi:transcriptional regulator with XRE-family HTH domain